MGKNKCLDEISKYLPQLAEANKKVGNVTDAAIQQIAHPQRKQRQFKQDYYNDKLTERTTEANHMRQQQKTSRDQLLRSKEEYNNYRILGNPKNAEDDGILRDNVEKYHGVLYQKYKDTSDKINLNAAAQHEQNMKELTTLNMYYSSQEAYSKRMYNLLDMKTQENKDLLLELEKLKHSGTTNDRKAVYEISASEDVLSARKIMYYIYYLSFILYLVFGRYFQDEKYRSVMVWIFMILYLSLPYYINYISNALIYLYRQIIYIMDNRLPKNVYTGI